MNLYAGEIMSLNLFIDINRHLVLRSDELPKEYCGRLFWICKLIVAWNRNMEVKFNLCWLICVDEHMVLNHHTPGQVHVKRKPHSMCSKYLAVAGADINISYFVIVEGKNKPKQGPNSNK